MYTCTVIKLQDKKRSSQFEIKCLLLNISNCERTTRVDVVVLCSDFISLNRSALGPKMHNGNASQSLQSPNISLQSLNLSLQSLNINLPSLNIHVYKKSSHTNRIETSEIYSQFFLFPQSEPRICYFIILKPGFDFLAVLLFS